MLGKCQSGGELRLSELSDNLNAIHVPDGFRLVGAKSPMLPGMTLVASIDKRYLPGEPDTVTMLGFSGMIIISVCQFYRRYREEQVLLWVYSIFLVFFPDNVSPLYQPYNV